jgi:hypothetical protein
MHGTGGRRMNRYGGFLRPGLAALAVLLAGAGAPQYPPSEAPAQLRRGVARAEAAIRAAACAAERRFGEGDPDANASRCEGVAAPAGVEVGRTSARLRNPRNAPPAWAKAYLTRTDGKKASEVQPAAFDLGDQVGVLRPIEIRSRCLSCHADRAQVAESTRAFLEQAYPQDQSFGYALGDLRGFWWAQASK